MMEQRLEELVVRGVGLAWVNGFSTIAVRALWETDRRPAAQRIAAALLPVERQARMGWMTDAPAREVDYPGEAQAELLGAHAARSGLEAVTALVARIGDRDGSAAVLARAAAVVVEPRLRPALRCDVLASASVPLDEATLSVGLGYAGGNDLELGRHLGAAACADDPAAAQAGLLVKIAELAVAGARCYADDALAARDDADRVARHRRRADQGYAEMIETGDRRAEGALRLARATRELAAGGDGEHVRGIVARLEQVWGAPRGWPIDPRNTAHVLCAAGRIDDVYKLELVLDTPLRIALAAALIRQRSVALAAETLADVLERPCLVTRRYLPHVYIDDDTRYTVSNTALTCKELLHLAELAMMLDAGARTRLQDRLAAATAALPATV